MGELRKEPAQKAQGLCQEETSKKSSLRAPSPEG